MSRKPITIVGGGLAGLTLGIGLRQQGVPVMIREAGSYPRHRVCGEFISGRGRETLVRLGLLQPVMAAGAVTARTTRFHSPRAQAPTQTLAEPALAISRYALDAVLAREFRRLGGELREGDRWRDGVGTEGWVRATGRRLAPGGGRWQWLGLKIHARNVPLQADLEMHLAPGGYVGISSLGQGEVNICGIFRRRAGAGSAPVRWEEALRGLDGSQLRERLAGAGFDEASFCSVAGLSLRPRRAEQTEECSVGDSITMIPPVTGNGMSMAFESAEVAIGPLAAWSAGEMGWTEARQAVARDCDARFARRLAWAWRLQQVLFMPMVPELLVRGVPRWPWLWRLLERNTR